MKRSTHLIVLAAMLLPIAAADAQSDPYALPPEPRAEPGTVATTSGGDPRITGCQVDLVEDIEAPAPEEGVVVFLGVKEGAEVRAEQVIAQIDDRQAQQALRIAEFALDAARARAEDEVEIKYSRAAARVAQAEVLEMYDANQQVEKAISPAEVRRAELEHERAQLGIEKAAKDQQLATLDADTKRAELEASRLDVDHRRVLAPFDGQILEVFRDQNEWVRPGDPIVRVARLDKLQVDGWVYFKDHLPREVDGCEVTIEVEVGRGQVARATGRVVYVSPLAEGFDVPKYRVRAEIANRREQGRWVISPGLDAAMTIHLGTGGAKLGAEPKRQR